MRRSLRDVPVNEMTGEELRRFLEEASGVRAPADNCGPDEWRRYMVAVWFATAAAEGGDAADIEARAIGLTLWCGSDLRPHLEEALGRKLTAVELAAAGLSAKSEPPGPTLDLIAAARDSHG
jgi:hypothetical protein